MFSGHAVADPNEVYRTELSVHFDDAESLSIFVVLGVLLDTRDLPVDFVLIGVGLNTDQGHHGLHYEHNPSGYDVQGGAGHCEQRDGGDSGTDSEWVSEPEVGHKGDEDGCQSPTKRGE